MVLSGTPNLSGRGIRLLIKDRKLIKTKYDRKPVENLYKLLYKQKMSRDYFKFINKIGWL